MKPLINQLLINQLLIKHFRISILGLILAPVVLSACESNADGAEIFVKSDPEAGAVLDYPPRTVRVFLTDLPDVDASSMTLQGAQGDVPLVHLHTMGANDLMAEISEYPLSPGEYSVQWTASLAENGKTYEGGYQFSVAAPQ